MKKFRLIIVTVLLCAVTATCSAFELDRTRWQNLANVNNIEVFYDVNNITKSGNVAKVWLCYHYKGSDSYRLICKEYTRGGDTTKIVKILDYYSDGTFKRGSNSVIPNVAFGTNERAMADRLW